MKSKSHHNGSLTVEAAVIIPIVLLMVIFVVMLGIMTYQKARFQAVVNQVATQYSKSYKHLASTRHDLYWRLYDSDKKDKETSITGLIQDKIFTSDVEVTVDVKSGIMGKKLLIGASKDFYMGKIKLTTFNAYAKTSLDDTTEMIRVFDLAHDLASEIELFASMEAKYNESLELVKEKIKSFF